MTRTTDKGRKALCLVEVILAVVILAVLASIAVPGLGWDAKGAIDSETAAYEFGGCLKLARALAITHASSNGSGYKVVLSGPFASYAIINADTSETVKGPMDIPQGVTCTGDSVFHFTPLGQLQAGGTLTLQFAQSSHIAVVRVTPIGRITVTE